MRGRFLLAFSLFFLTAFQSVHAQNRGQGLRYRFFSFDSLRGFDEAAFRINAIHEGYIGNEFDVALYQAQRQYIQNRFYPVQEETNYFETPQGKVPGGNNIFAAPCVNEGFEMGNFTGWTLTRGSNTNSCAYPIATLALTPGPLATVLATPLTDPVTGVIIPNSPLGGTMVARLNNNAPTGKVVKMAQNFVVTNSNYLYDFAYYAIQNGPHNCCQQPYMFVRLRDCVGNLLACPNFTFNAPATNSALCVGTGPTAWINTGVCPGGQCIWRTNGWQRYSMDLTQYIGTCLTVEVMVADCSPTGHYLYSYFDSNCNTMNLTVNGTNTISMPTQTVIPQVLCGTTATLTAPSGLNPYLWNGPPLSGVTNNTNQTISTAVAGNYTLQMTPVGVCNPIFRIINLQFVPPTTINVVPAGGICIGGSSTLTASGALNYTWQPGGSNATSIVVSPTATTIYTLTAQSGTCLGTFTTQVAVNPSPTVNVSASSLSVCAGQPSTLTATGANTYTWSTGATGSVAVVNPTTTTVFSVVGTSTAGCTASASISINVVPNPTNIITFANPTLICIGGNANLFVSATGALTYSWFPGGLVGNFVNVSPTVTTIYTVIAANGSCTNSAQQTLNVDPGPSMTVVASPTSICPGNSATLTASGATGYTWSPMGTTGATVVVSPTVTTTYSVTGLSLNGCTSTQTFVMTVDPVPTVAISPASPSICIGNSQTLTASGAASYTWSPGGALTPSVVVNPTITTTYTVIGSNGTCTSSATETLVVVPLPTVGATASSPSICSGQTATLTGSGATNYTWNPGGLTGANVAVSPTVTTNYTVTGDNGACTNTAVVTLSVNYGPTLTPVANPTNICAGGSATLSASGALNYTWNPGALTGGTVTVSPGVTTVYSVTGDNAFGCTTTETVSLNVTPNPTVGATASSPSICAGSSATLTGNGATSYTWNPGGLTGVNVVVTPTSTTTYTLIGSTGGCNDQTTIAISVVPVPTVSALASPTAICEGSSSTLTASGATSYTWNPGALTGSNVVVSPIVNTTYTVTGDNGACSSTSTLSILVNPNPTLVANASPTAICVSGNVTLTVNGANSYTWNPGALTGSNVVVTTTATTQYTVFGSSIAGCTGTTAVTVTVDALPIMTLAATPTAICSGNSATLSASGATSYTWNPGGLTGANVVVTPTASTVYTVSGTNGVCVGTQTISLNVNPIPTVAALANPTTICAGASATLTASGATSYTWNPGALSGSSVVVNPSVTTVYTVTGNDLLGCSSTATVSLNVSPIPTLVVVANPTVVCIGSSATLAANGATSYTWNPGALTGSNVVVSPTATTIYTIDGSNGTCSSSQTLNLVVAPQPTLTANASPNPVCLGSSVTLTVSGASTYTWVPGALTGSNIVTSPTVSTNYTVVGTSTANCSNFAIVSVSVNPQPTLGVTSSNTNICAGQTATLTASGAITYTWNPGGMNGTTVAVTPTSTTVYTVVGTSATGCTNVVTFTQVVTPNPTVIANASPTAICISASATLTATGALTYTWNPGALTGSNVVVTPTSTTIYTVTGANGICTSTQTLNLTVNPLPVLATGANPNPSCPGSPVTLTVSGASTYTWNPGALTGSNVVVTPTANTTYTVVGVSLAGCTNSATVTQSINPQPTLGVVSSNTNICAGQTATLTASGALTYTWNPGALNGTSVAVTPSSTTVYTIIGTSALGCTNVVTFTQVVTPNPTITANASPTAICVGASATLTANGALTYTWNPGALTGSNVVVTPTATTIYTINGANGACAGTQTLNLIVNPLPTLTTGASPNPVCAGSPVTLTVGGANTYTWNPGAITGSTAVVTPTTNTNYTVNGTSLAGCTSSAIVSVTVNPLPSLTVTSSNTNICSGSTATLTAGGGVTYIWNPGGIFGATIAVTPTATTVYTLNGTSGFGCLNTITFTQVVTPTPTVVATASLATICAGSSSTLSATGASSYTWNPGALTGSNVVVTPTSTTIYTVTGANGNCSSTQTLQVTVDPTPTLLASASPSAFCFGNSTTLTVTGANSYTWNPGALTGSNVVVTPTASTGYTVVGINGNGCTASTIVNVTVNPLPTLSISPSATNICEGTSATLTASGANSYTWNPGALNGTSVVVSPTSTTVYTLSGESVTGCTNTIQFTLNVTPNPTITAVASPTTICAGASSTLTANGATSYTWNPGALTGSNVVVTPTASTIYTVDGSNGSCSSTTTLALNVDPLPVLTVQATPSIICSGETITLSATGANSYTWNPGALNGSTVAVTPTVNTSYTVIGESLAGCTSSAVIDVTVNPIPNPSITATGTVICLGDAATLTASGALTYTWDPGALTGTSVVVSPTVLTVYTLTAMGAGGCTATANFAINVTPAPIISATSSSSLICSGESATLTASGATNYTWNPGALNGASVVVSPSVSTTYTVSGDNGGCTSSTVITINVNPSPTVTAAANPSVVCAGTTVSLTANGAIVYAWLPIAQTGSAVVDNPTVTTTYTVIGSDGTCTNTAFVTVTVNPAPSLSIVASPTSVCLGGSLTLTGSGATNYTWQPSGANTPTIVDSPTITTTYTLLGDNGSCTGSLAITVSVNPGPTVTALANPTVVCAGSTVSLTGTGGVTYTWNPIGVNGATVTDTPTLTTNYTLTATDGNGCTGTATVDVLVNPAPSVTATPSSTSICLGQSATITANGANTYTWNPGALSGSLIVVSPTVSTTYTITGDNGGICQGTQTVQIVVLPTPTLTAVSNPTALCSGSSATLTAGGALTYTWEPGTIISATAVVNPTVTTSYTLYGSNGICGSATTVITLTVNEVPANVTASVSGIISCNTPSVNLFGSTTTTNVAYLWNGPGAYTSAVQNPTGIAIPGIYTLNVINLNGGCNSTATVAVTTDSSIPTTTITQTGTITCANQSATLSAATTATNAGYNWSGPNSFTNTAQTVTISVGGTYTLTVTDLDNSCQSSTFVTVISDTFVPITATLVPATCNGTIANNDAQIVVAGFGAADKYDFVVGPTYTGTATYATATLIPVGGVLTNTLNNPLTPTPYTVRFFGSNGCTKDTTMLLMPTSCMTNTVFGIAKAVSTATLKTNGTYDVEYTVVIRNTGAQTLNNIMLTENLALTFPAPTTFSIINAPVVTSLNNSIVIEPTFDGSVQTVMTNTLTSAIAAGKTDTIIFKLNVDPKGIFGPFNNTVHGFASPTLGVVFADSSNTGYDPDPDTDGNPTNNNLPTILNLNPNQFFGLTKVGTLSEKLPDNTYDISYTITVHNLGNDTLRNVVVKDSLFNNTIKSPATYVLKSGPTVTGSLVANTSYNGNSDVNLVNPLLSKLPPGTTHSIMFTINVTPDTMTVVRNSATGSAVGTGTVLVQDISNNGSDPDTNDNGVWNEDADNVPTVLVIPNSTLFIPGGFSPDGDNKNETWNIKGLPQGNTVTIFNRWGQKVYQKTDYDNTWAGYPNVSGTLGNEKLSQGTYYYIIEFKDSSIKPEKGFVIIQY